MIKSRIWKCNKKIPGKYKRPIWQPRTIYTEYVTPKGVFTNLNLAILNNDINITLLYFKLRSNKYPRYFKEYVLLWHYRKPILRGPGPLEFTSMIKAAKYYKISLNKLNLLLDNNNETNWIRL